MAMVSECSRKREGMACWDAHSTHSKCVQMQFREWIGKHREVKEQSKIELSCIKKQIKLYELLSFTFVREHKRLTMLLWSSPSSFCNLEYCRGEPPACFAICNVVLVNLLFVLYVAMLLWWAPALFDIGHVAVVKHLLILLFALLVWSSFCSLCNLQCCCNKTPTRFVIRNVAVVMLLLAL